jgi:chromosome partitioning protein
MAVIAVFNQKGGVGKTTTALNLCAGLAQLGLGPLGIDFDPQGHLTLGCGASTASADASACAFFRPDASVAAAVQTLPTGLRLIPAAPELSKVDALHGADPQIATRLKHGIDGAIGRSAPVLIDCCPMLGVLTLNALIAADRVLIPVSADYLSLQGVERLDRALGVLETKLQRPFERRIVVTRFDGRRRLSTDIDARVRALFGAAVCETRITENVSLAESPMRGKDIYAHAPASPGARDYRALTAELGRSGFFS